jgi:hypothetical protein
MWLERIEANDVNGALDAVNLPSDAAMHRIEEQEFADTELLDVVLVTIKSLTESCLPSKGDSPILHGRRMPERGGGASSSSSATTSLSSSDLPTNIVPFTPQDS